MQSLHLLIIFAQNSMYAGCVAVDKHSCTIVGLYMLFVNRLLYEETDDIDSGACDGGVLSGIALFAGNLH